MFTDRYKMFSIKLMNLINNYDFMDIKDAFKKFVHCIVTEKNPDEIREIFNQNNDLTDSEKEEILNTSVKF